MNHGIKRESHKQRRQKKVCEPGLTSISINEIWKERVLKKTIQQKIVT